MNKDNNIDIIPIEKMHYEDRQVAIDDCSVQYIQSSDCTEEEGAQSITISTRNNGIARFLNIKTGQEGWSISDIGELEKIIEDFKERCSYTKDVDL